MTLVPIIGLLRRVPQVPSCWCWRSFGPTQELAFQPWNVVDHRSVDYSKDTIWQLKKMSARLQLVLLSRRNIGGPYYWWAWPSSFLWVSSSNVVPCTLRHPIRTRCRLSASPRRYATRTAPCGGSGTTQANNSPFHRRRTWRPPILLDVHNTVMVKADPNIIGLRVTAVLVTSLRS